MANWAAVARLALPATPPLAAEAATYRKALWAWWSVPEAEPLAVFHDALVTLRAAEAACPPATIRAVLQEAAEAWHREMGRCPFCEKLGPLHLPAEALLEATP